ncbi:conserved hypothetical protein [Neospora caninum Liverpool]|uniref:Uncharacterized protein n=1 Tax=Neospora caninum (strain Liverpool) TaxID=572307 RepID=F0V868_NEOCL|nr:conserved hypothetical protein [Neospora caninum Liverpool]CBZ49909.1 conserved hypothetical protein [Neospora caninum Liverpool]CEL64496.1 TPA: hypothetical protein BN1204_003930 [Neospora caninum Liverpool]|eukprot:XP_003879944.1 conserved hypothetical protein [Neospora caninum Liverpool]
MTEETCGVSSPLRQSSSSICGSTASSSRDGAPSFPANGVLGKETASSASPSACPRADSSPSSTPCPSACSPATPCSSSRAPFPSLPSSSASSSPSFSSLSCLFNGTLHRLHATSEAAAALGKSASSLLEELYAVVLERDALEENEQRQKQKRDRVEATGESDGEGKDACVSPAGERVVNRLERLLLSLQSILNQERELALQGQEAVGSLDAALRLHLKAEPSFLGAGGTDRKAPERGTETNARQGDAASPWPSSTASSSLAFPSCSSASGSSVSSPLAASPTAWDTQQGSGVGSGRESVHVERARREKEAVCAFLVLCSRLASSLEEDVQFKQSVKEELCHFAPAETLRAAKIAFLAEPYVWEQTDLLQKARLCLDAWTRSTAREGEDAENQEPRETEPDAAARSR